MIIATFPEKVLKHQDVVVKDFQLLTDGQGVTTQIQTDILFTLQNNL